jgi:sialic acid synthase SpsE
MIIAEAGISNNGSIKLAKKLVDVAKRSGADAVKFQTFWDIGRLKEYELTKAEFIELKEYCDKKGILFLSTPHCKDAIYFVDELVPIHKIASPYITDEIFVKEIASREKPVLMSTGSLEHVDGMATDNEIKRALKWLEGCEVILLHCVSKYPCYFTHLERIEQLKKFGKTVGLSDHSKEIYLPKYPIVEKHIKLFNSECIDDNVSLDPDEFRAFVVSQRC